MHKPWKTLPGSRREPAGLERVVLRRLPLVTLAGTALCVLPALIGRWRWGGDLSAEALRALQMADIWSAATVVLWWTAVLTVALVCFVVMVMKGPAYVADRYDMPDSDRPV